MAAKLKLSPRAVSHWEQGLRTPNWPVVQSIALVLGVSPESLGSLPASPEPPTNPVSPGRPKKPPIEPAQKPPTRRVRLLGLVGAGPGLDVEYQGEWVEVADTSPDDAVAYRITGDSMRDDAVLPGDVVLIRPNPDPPHGAKALVYLAGDGMVLKTLKLVKARGKRYRQLESAGWSHIIREGEDVVWGEFVSLHRNA